ncbi:MAG TPA: hypothetical protein VFH06_01025 [Candidatus Saccharimonadales bacterium]|nr:hypothetical protein [Candidatus Saccharimonadales bacterium]
MRKILWFVVLGAAALALLVSGCSGSPVHQSRAEYQAKLDASPIRFDASTQVIGKGGRLYIKKGASATQSCLKLCGTIEPKDSADPQSGFKVALPIGFRVAMNTPQTLADGLVTELTYWNPLTQAEEGVPYERDRAIEVPSSLISKTVNDLAEVKEGFIQGAYVHPTHDGSWVVDRDIPLWREPLGLDYGMTVTVRITENDGKPSVCVPSGTVLSSTVTDDGIQVSRSC